MSKIAKILAFVFIMSFVGIIAFNCGGSTKSTDATDSTAVDTTAVGVDTTAVSGGVGTGVDGTPIK